MSDKALVGDIFSWSPAGTWARASAAVLEFCERWRERARTRRDLAAMSGRELRELGVTQAMAREEMARAPWFDYSPEWRIAGSERRARFAARRR